MIEAIQHTVMWACLWTLAALAVCALLSLVAKRKQVRPVFAHIPPVPCVVLLVVMAVCTLFSGKNTNSPPAGIMSPILPHLTGGTPVVPVVVTPEEIAQEWRLASVVTNDAVSYAMPTNGVAYAPWTLRGGYVTHFPLDLGDFAFPLGTGVVHRLDVLSGGMVESFPRPSCMSICAAREWASLIPGESGFWWADLVRPEPAPYHVKLLTWENVYAGRDRTGLYSAQIELWSDGNFLTRSNNVENVYRRVTPFDWDDDGLENSVDPDPYVAGPDAHGTNAEWYNIVCSNVLEATTATILPELMWREGVNSNGYYFVDVVTTNGPAPIYFMGDRESRLGNPVVVARACETNHVPLLIGVDYAITSSVPFTVSIPEDYMYPVVETNEPCRAHVRWPLNFVFHESIGASNRVYTVTVEPFDPGGMLEWGSSSGAVPMRGILPNDGCDCLHYGFDSVCFTCSSTCTNCMGCTAEGCYHLENTTFFVAGGQCRCGFDDPPYDDLTQSAHDPDDPPSLTITFSKQAVIFEDAFLEKTDVTIPKRSTRVRLTIDAYGGQGGGTLSLTGVNMDKLIAVDGGVTLPYSRILGSGESYHVTGVYEGAEGSDTVADIVVQGGIAPNYPYNAPSATSSITAVEVTLEAEYYASGNPCAARHTYGVGEKVHFSVTPASSDIKLRVVKADASDYVTPYDTIRGGNVFLDVSEANASETRTYVCPATGTRPNIAVRFAGIEYRPVMAVVEPHAVEASIAFGGTRFWLGQVGFGCLTTVNYISPNNVSFEGIAAAEIPCTEAIPPTGYYASSYYTGPLTHTDLAGAGNVISIKELNYWCRDQAGYDNPIDNWSAGMLVWKIPVGWKRLLFDGDPPGRTSECDYERNNDATSRPLLIGGRTDAYTQTYLIDADGTASVEKFGWRLIRTRWSVAGRVEEITER